jgi:hypothetical protein
VRVLPREKRLTNPERRSAAGEKPAAKRRFFAARSDFIGSPKIKILRRAPTRPGGFDKASGRP